MSLARGSRREGAPLLRKTRWRGPPLRTDQRAMRVSAPKKVLRKSALPNAQEKRDAAQPWPWLANRKRKRLVRAVQAKTPADSPAQKIGEIVQSNTMGRRTPTPALAGGTDAFLPLSRDVILARKEGIVTRGDTPKHPSRSAPHVRACAAFPRAKSP